MNEFRTAEVPVEGDVGHVGGPSAPARGGRIRTARMSGPHDIHPAGSYACAPDNFV
jgi:hypothetical protein